MDSTFCNSTFEPNHELIRIYSKLNFFYLFYFQGSRDNMSIIIIVFPGGPKQQPEAVQAEADLDAYILKRMKGCYKKIFCR